MSQLGGGSLTYNPRGMGTYTTDEDGRFSIPFEGDVDGIFELYADKLYYNNPRGLSDFTFEGGSNQRKSVNLKLHPWCWVWIHVKSKGEFNLASGFGKQFVQPRDSTFIGNGYANEQNREVVFFYKYSSGNPRPEDTIKKYYYSAPPFDTTHLYVEY